MESPEDRRDTAALPRTVAEGSDPDLAADVMVTTWRTIDAALSPILGHLGVAALYRRSLHLTMVRYPWLSSSRSGAPIDMDLDALRSTLLQQNSADAKAAGNHLLQTFRELLTTLVGASLSERLLHSVWSNSLSAPSAQDT